MAVNIAMPKLLVNCNEKQKIEIKNTHKKSLTLHKTTGGDHWTL